MSFPRDISAAKKLEKEKGFLACLETELCKILDFKKFTSKKFLQFCKMLHFSSKNASLLLLQNDLILNRQRLHFSLASPCTRPHTVLFSTKMPLAPKLLPLSAPTSIIKLAYNQNEETKTSISNQIFKTSWRFRLADAGQKSVVLCEEKLVELGSKLCYDIKP